MGRRAKFDDGEILDRAMAAVWRQGWSTMSVRQLETALDLKAPALYRRFGSKEGLGTAVVRRYVDRVVRRRIARYLHGEGDPLDNVRAFLVSAVDPLGEGCCHGCLLTTTAVALEALGPEMAAAVADGRGLIARALAAELARADRLGQLAPGTSSEDAASALFLLMQGLMVAARTGAEPEALRRRAEAAVGLVAA